MDGIILLLMLTVQRLEDVEGIGEVPDFPRNSSQVLQDFSLRVQDLDALRVRVVAGREVLRDRGSEFAERKKTYFAIRKATTTKINKKYLSLFETEGH